MSESPRTRVIGIAYDIADPAPVVVLKGSGQEAEAVLARARDNGEVPVIRDAGLVNALYRLPVDAPIGRELFPVMAALIAHVMKIDLSREKQDL